MKLIIAIFSLLLSGAIGAQVVVPCDSQRVENSKRNYMFAIQNKGKKVDNGICRDLVYKAIKRSHKDDLSEVLTNAKQFEIRSAVDVIRGDVVTFKNVVYRDDIIKFHTGIIIDMLESGFFYAHQNAGNENDESVKVIDENGKEVNVFIDSKVEIGYFEYKDKKSGVVQFFRF